MIRKVAFFAQPTGDIAAAKSFWGDLLGLELEVDYGGKWAEYRTPEGKTIALDSFSAEREGATPYLALETDDFEGDLQRLREAGVEVLMEPTHNKDEQGLDICSMAIVKDPAGNPLMLHQIADRRREED
jgi:predicted enzyme related to lactoylglutathione lyase